MRDGVANGTGILAIGSAPFLAGGGDMGRRMREHEWSATPLGHVGAWPQSLRSAVSICLNSRFPIAIYWGPQLALLYNDAWSPIPGKKHPWALGKPGREVWPEIWDAIGPLYAQVQSSGEGVWQQDQLLPMHRHGYTEECYFNFTFSPIRGEDGQVEGIFNAVVETTFRVIEERRTKVLRELLEETVKARTAEQACEYTINVLGKAAADVPFCLVYLCDTDRKTAQLAAGTVLPDDTSLAPNEIDLNSDRSTWPLRDTDHIQLVEHADQKLGTALPGGYWPEPGRDAYVAPIAGATPGKPAGYLIAGVSPRRADDAEYRGFVGRAAAQISSVLATVRSFEAERKRAEALAEVDKAKTRFFSNVSHELRTPLTLMLGPIEDALAAGEALPKEQRERLDVAQRNAQRLLKLVNSLLDFTRIEAGRIDASYEPVDLAEFTGDLASSFRSAIERAGLEFVVDTKVLSQSVYVDRDMWEKIVLNLLSNAFKFTFAGRITLRLRPNSEGQSVELVVRDTGVGVPAGEVARLFERFYRVEGQRSRSFEGSGIGLALVSELVRLHGGRIAVESHVNVGTTFTVTVPLGLSHLPQDKVKKAGSSIVPSLRSEAFVGEALRWLPQTVREEFLKSGTAEASEYLIDERAGSARIVVADDNADMRDYVGRLLAGRWNVELVADGRAALDSIRRERPDLVLTDMMMPELDGFGLIKEIRTDDGLRDLPVIILSARAGEEARVEGLSAGADDYLIKPFSARELVARIASNLKLAQVRKDATASLRESELRFRNMADNAPVMLWVTDASGACTYLNKSWYDFTGQTEEEALGFGWLEAIHPDDREAAASTFVKSNVDHEPFRLNYRVRRNDGIYRWAIDAASPRVGPDGKFAGYIGSVVDITERKEAEQVLEQQNEILRERIDVAVADHQEVQARLHQAQKMEAVGRLTGGVAHDFNNLLQVVGGNLQLLLKDVAGNERGEQRLRNALAGVSRGAKLASQLLAFGRRQPLAPKVISIGRMIRNLDDMLRRALGEAIEMETVIAGGLWNTMIDPVQFETAMLNLAINGRDAMEGRGKLTIEAGNASLDEEYVLRHPDVQAGQYVMMAMSDTGVGMTSEVIEQVFEPFFTTKPEGQGTGLGLSMVFGFVKQSGGHIKIYSEPGQGTTVRLYLPRSKAREDVLSEVEVGPAAGGSETILVVEDDDDVRKTAVDILSDLGYRVLKAKDADSALIIIESGVPIDVLFTDVVMPGNLRSPELARKAKERIPHLAVLFTSGYTDNAIVHGGRLDPNVELLSKPYTREALARKLRHVISNEKQRSQARAPAQINATAEPNRSLRILLVEDDVLIRLSTADMLGNLGHEVLEAANGKDALDLLVKEKFEVLLTDVGLPGMTGTELSNAALNIAPRLRVIFATGYDKIEEFASGVLLRKPYTERALAEALERAMGQN